MFFFHSHSPHRGDLKEGGVLGAGLDHEEPTIGVVDADVPIDAEKVLRPHKGIDEEDPIQLLEDGDSGVLEIRAIS